MNISQKKVKENLTVPKPIWEYLDRSVIARTG
jgi:hypothetical protein